MAQLTRSHGNEELEASFSMRSLLRLVLPRISCSFRHPLPRLNLFSHPPYIFPFSLSYISTHRSILFIYLFPSFFFLKPTSCVLLFLNL